MALLKYSQIRQDLLCFCLAQTQNPLFTKFCDLKGADFCVDFVCSEAHKAITPMCANEPKDAESQPFKAGSGLNALAS